MPRPRSQLHALFLRLVDDLVVSLDDLLRRLLASARLRTRTTLRAIATWRSRRPAARRLILRVKRLTRFRAALLVVQGALSVMLLVGAGLFVRSLQAGRARPQGYDAERVDPATMLLRDPTG